MMKIIFFAALCVLQAQGDIYMHNPRGSNNRLDESGRERNNANRLFDSQNNNRGGYNVGSLYYYVGSKLPIEWTNQHSCAGPNNHCELVIQYMCSDNLRDGSTTSTIPDNLMMCDNYDCNTATQYGMHEDYDYYMNCRMRERNMGLFLASQNLGGHKDYAKNTRQNPNGNRRGYECPEERDYYPYWHPTPWKDIAVLTNDATRCDYYKSESENVKGRWACVIPRMTLIYNSGIKIPNNEEDCDNFRWPTNDPDGVRGVWTEFPSHGIAAPTCRETEFTRDNHLGNGPGGYPNLFNWTIPDDVNSRCALRIRYNISTTDYDAWNTTAEQNPLRNKQPPQVPFAERLGFNTEEEAQERGYALVNNPQVEVFPGVALQLAVNTAQFGRTFQDRSHVFSIVPRPGDLSGANIHNVNVRGKRGNIVQVYPAVEYDFVPNTLRMSAGDYVHFQWTGSNTNPHNNDGQGRAGTDRSNVVVQSVQAYHEGMTHIANASDKNGHWGRSYPAYLDTVSFLGFGRTDLQSLALLTPNHFGGEMSELDDAGTYFDLGPRKVTQNGLYHYMCSRNNNFSNRSQKGRIICKNSDLAYEAIGSNGGDVSTRRALLSAPEGTFEKLWKVELEEISTEEMEQRVQSKGQQLNDLGDGYASPFLIISPEEQLAAEGQNFQITIDIDSPGVDDIHIYRANGDLSQWTTLDADISGKTATFAAQHGGAYVAVRHSKTGVIVGAVVGVLVLIAILVGGTLLYRRHNPEVFVAFTRSFQQKV